MIRLALGAMLMTLAAGQARAENWVVAHVWTGADEGLGERAYAVDLESMAVDGDRRTFMIAGVYRQRQDLLDRPWDYDLMRWRIDCSTRSGAQSDYWPGSIDGGHHYHSDDLLEIDFDPVGRPGEGDFPGRPEDIAVFRRVCGDPALRGQGSRSLTALVRALRRDWPEERRAVADRLGPGLNDLLGPGIE